MIEIEENIYLSHKNIRTLHEDAIKLLKDLDPLYRERGFDSIFNNTISSGVSTSIEAAYYLFSDCIYRYWRKKDSLNIKGITIFFYDWKERFKYPFISFANIKVSSKSENDIRWILWNTIVENKLFDFNEINNFEYEQNNIIYDIEFISVPLININSIEDADRYAFKKLTPHN